MGIGGFLSDIGDGIAHGIEGAVEGLNVVDRYINPFHEEQTLTPAGKKAVEEAGPTAQQGILAPGLEDTMSGLKWLRDNAISQPLATTALVGKMNRGNESAFGGDYFNTKAWSQAWHAAEHISPGQALLLSPDEAKAAIDSPLLYYKPPEAYLPPGFHDLPEAQQQKILKDAGLPAVGNAYIEKMRGNTAWYKYGTGSIDFASAIFADPTIIGGKLIGGARELSVVNKAPAGGRSVAEIDRLVNSGKVRRFLDGVWANKDNPQLLNNTKLVQRSGMGPRFGSIVSSLQTEEELHLFFRVGLGDTDAIKELRLANADAAGRMDSDLTRLGGLNLMRSTYASNPHILNVVENQIQQTTARRAADAALINRYDDILANADLLDELHLTRNAISRAETVTQAQNQYVAGAARGGLVRGQARGVTLRPSTPPLTFTRQAAPPVINTGVVHTRLWGAGDYFTAPVTMIRMLKNSHPNGFMYIDMSANPQQLKDSITELRGHLARIPGIKESTRAGLVNDFLKATTEHERLDVLEGIGHLGAAKVAAKYGMSPELGQEIFRKAQDLKRGEIDNMKRYTGALDPERVNAAGQPLHLDSLEDLGGGVSVTPFTASRLINGHTFQDLDELDKVLRRHGDKLMTLYRATGNAKDALAAWADYGSYLWKFTTLFRLGYVPRVLGDDLGSQWARVGTAAMALRVAKGTANAFDNAARWVAKPALQAREQNAAQGLGYAADEMALLRPQIKKLENFLKAQTIGNAKEATRAAARHKAAQQKLATLDPLDRSPKAMAIRQLASQRASQLTQAQARVSAGPSPGKTAAVVRMKDQHDFLQRYHDLQTRNIEDLRAKQQKVIQGNQAVEIDGKQWSSAFGGRGGQYALEQISADQSVGNLFATNKQLVQGNLERSFDHGGKSISALQDSKVHLKAWSDAINQQIASDPLSRMAIKGASIKEMTDWLRLDARGMRYRARLPKNFREEEFARSAKYEVDQYLHTPEIRMQALTPEGVSEDFLNKAVPNIVDRPDVHVGQVGQTQLQHAHALDRLIGRFYDVAASLPANRMSRHPLFNQFYEGHLKRIVAQRGKQGVNVNRMTVAEEEQLVHSARQLALRDTRSLVFDIAHRSDAAAALRFLSPFFSATTEAFQRWGRVIADKPQTVGYASNWYNAPAYLNKMQDQDGNHIDDKGYAYIPQYPLNADGSVDYTGQPKIIKRLVPKSERLIVTRMPKWVVQSPLGALLNVRESNGSLLLSQNSIDMVTQGDPWFNPGVGPIVQIPVNEWVKDKPRQAEIARHLSILPFGVQGGGAFGENPLGRGINLALPAVIRNAVTAYDTSDERYQSVKMQITNRAIYEHDVLGKPMPTAQMIADRTRQYWFFAAAASFVQPFATQRKDPYQFYYDQYNALRRQNSLTADDEFLSRYGESLFIFAAESSKSNGIPSTRKAIDLERKYANEIAENPELAALYIGPEGNGPFSPEAYRYELNNPLVPGGAEMQRMKLSATEAIDENRRRLGWAKYTKKMNQLTAELHKAGFRSFDESGAEDFADQRKAWTSLYSEPLYPDGTPNENYNEQWSKDFFTQDLRKYDRLIPGLTKLANSPLAQLPERSDLRKLQEYLGGRKALNQELRDRKAAGLPATLAAQQNDDLRQQWAIFVDQLIEESPRFGDLYHRYLSRDLNVNAQEEVQ